MSAGLLCTVNRYESKSTVSIDNNAIAQLTVTIFTTHSSSYSTATTSPPANYSVTKVI